jgi:hypothetical protein
LCKLFLTHAHGLHARVGLIEQQKQQHYIGGTQRKSVPKSQQILKQQQLHSILISSPQHSKTISAKESKCDDITTATMTATNVHLPEYLQQIIHMSIDLCVCYTDTICSVSVVSNYLKSTTTTTTTTLLYTFCNCYSIYLQLLLYASPYDLRALDTTLAIVHLFDDLSPFLSRKVLLMDKTWTTIIVGVSFCLLFILNTTDITWQLYCYNGTCVDTTEFITTETCCYYTN